MEGIYSGVPTFNTPSTTSTPNTIGSFLLNICCGNIFIIHGYTAIASAVLRRASVRPRVRCIGIHRSIWITINRLIMCSVCIHRE